MKYITLTNGMKAIVDDEDFDFLSQFTWSCSKGYAYSALRFREPNGMANRCPYSMHVMINGCPLRGMHTDHINRNRLDNRRANLRVVTRSVNLCNSDYMDQHRRTTVVERLRRSTRKAARAAAKMTRGRPRSSLVHAYRHGKRYRAVACMGNRNVYLGLYDSKEEACAKGHSMLLYKMSAVS